MTRPSSQSAISVQYPRFAIRFTGESTIPLIRPSLSSMKKI